MHPAKTALRLTMQSADDDRGSQELSGQGSIANIGSVVPPQLPSECFATNMAIGIPLRDWSNIDSDIEREDGAGVVFNVDEQSNDDRIGGNISNEMEIGINRIFSGSENFPAAPENVQPAESAVPNANLSRSKSNTVRC